MNNFNNSCKYKICQIVGEGATSTVYRAVDLLENKTVAIKVFTSKNNTSVAALKRLENEHRILTVLSSEHIIKLEGTVSKNSFAMEYCENSLISFLNEHELDVRGVKKIIRMILLGVYEMHRKGIIHRDLKLGNILLKDDCVKICDFGLSCFKSENDFSYCGTKDYLAPEMERRKNVLFYDEKVNVTKDYVKPVVEKKNVFYYDEKVDVYAIGVIYKILLSRRKNVEISEIEAPMDVKRLLNRLLLEDSEKRISVLDALKHESFEELFQKVPDFRTLKEHSKITRYGTVNKCKKGNNHSIEILYESNRLEIYLEKQTEINTGINTRINKEDYLEINKEDYLEINKEDYLEINTEIHSKILFNGITVDKRLLNNSQLKYFNYLVSYFKLLMDRTIVFRQKEGIYSFYKTLGNRRVLECSKFKFIRDEKTRELIYFTEKGEIKSKEIPEEIEILFKRFDIQNIKRTGKNTIENTVISMETTNQNISISQEFLIRKFYFCSGFGWGVKEGNKIVILLNSGDKIEVGIEDFTMKMNGKDRVSIEKGELKELEMIRRFTYEIFR